ncbi:MAG TPA: winged helix-turn-helix domain-containing protein [Thermoanaerobaculia bacterium]|jgi:Tol biopolymer transport system component/DNA-binding winged helix-turn-helix (wHTH) protein|nr:winged helix-turn-helix domain-containing protein [Thermoanaerobaculia bacterium]
MSSPVRHFYEFGPYRIDTVNRRLLRDGELVPLKAKVVETLLLLIEHCGEVLEKDDLMRRLWPDSFVEEANLTQNIYVLRKALGVGSYIETVPRRGYRFVGEIRQWEAAPSSRTNAPDGTPETSFTGFADERARSVAPAGLRTLWSTLLILAVIAAGAVAFWPRRHTIPFEKIQLTRLTTTGNAVRAAISPEGRYMAYVASEAGRQSLRLRQIATGKDLELVPSSSVDFYGLTFSHDGNFIYYTSQEMNHLGLLFRLPSLGGTPARLAADVDSPVTLSPDDQHLAFVRFSPKDRAIVVSNADGTGERRLASSSHALAFRIAPTPLIAPAWSPDGRILACAVGVATSEADYQTVWSFNARNGTGRPLTSAHWKTLGRMEWLPDGKELLLTAAGPGSSGTQQIWLLSSDGRTRQITKDLADYREVSLTPDARSLVAVQSERRGNVWVAPADDTDRATQVTFTNYDGLGGGLSWTPDGRIVYTLPTGAEQNLWIVDPKGGSPEQLTSHAGVNRQPAVAPDGRYIVFVSDRSGRQRLWRIDADGGHPHELTHGSADREPSFSPDGKWVVFSSSVAGRGSVFRVGIDGGEPVRLTDRASGEPNVSPDGALLSLYYRSAPAAPNKISVMPSSGGEPRAIRDLPPHFGRFRWTPDGRALAYSAGQEGVGNIWLLPLDGSAPAPITHWGTEPVFSFDWSRDGKWLAYVKGAITSDVIRIEDLTR